MPRDGAIKMRNPCYFEMMTMIMEIKWWFFPVFHWKNSLYRARDYSAAHRHTASEAVKWRTKVKTLIWIIKTGKRKHRDIFIFNIYFLCCSHSQEEWREKSAVAIQSNTCFHSGANFSELLTLSVHTLHFVITFPLFVCISISVSFSSRCFDAFSLCLRSMFYNFVSFCFCCSSHWTISAGKGRPKSQSNR